MELESAGNQPGKGNAPEVSVVIPVYKNARTVEELHQRLGDVLRSQARTFEILFVEDACPDGSLKPLVELTRRDSRVCVLSLARNAGQHRAVLVGLAQARGHTMVVMDADLQDPPEAIPVLLARLGEGYSAVFAGKRGLYEPPLRQLGGRVFKRLLHILFGIPMDAGMFFAINRQMAEQLLAFYAPAPYLVAMISCTGLPLTCVPVRRSPRRTGRSAYNTWKRLKVAIGAVLWTMIWKGWPPARRAKRPRAADVRAAFGSRFRSA